MLTKAYTVRKQNDSVQDSQSTEQTTYPEQDRLTFISDRSSNYNSLSMIYHPYINIFTLSADRVSDRTLELQYLQSSASTDWCTHVQRCFTTQGEAQGIEELNGSNTSNCSTSRHTTEETDQWPPRTFSIENNMTNPRPSQYGTLRNLYTRIISYDRKHTVHTKKSNVVFYKILVRDVQTSIEWTVYKRYNDFVALRKVHITTYISLYSQYYIYIHITITSVLLFHIMVRTRNSYSCSCWPR